MKYTKNMVRVVAIVAVLGLILVCFVNHEGFAGESLYDLMEKEAQISNDVYLQKIREADVIQSNPWIMIDPVNKNATIHPRGVLDRLTGQQSDKLSWHPRAYYDYSDVVYTGLPL
jgi:hypothetical protein